MFYLTTHSTYFIYGYMASELLIESTSFLFKDQNLFLFLTGERKRQAGHDSAGRKGQPATSERGIQKSDRKTEEGAELYAGRTV